MDKAILFKISNNDNTDLLALKTIYHNNLRLLPKLLLKAHTKNNRNTLIDKCVDVFLSGEYV